MNSRPWGPQGPTAGACGWEDEEEMVPTYGDCRRDAGAGGRDEAPGHGRDAWLAAGHALFASGDRWVVRGPRGAMAVVDPAAVPARVESPEQIDPDRDREFVAAFRSAGYATPPPSETSRAQLRIGVGGHPAAASAVRQLLESEACATRLLDRPEDDDLAGLQAVTWLGPLSAAGWRRLDALATDGALVWQRSAVEGGQAFLEPVASGAGSVTHAMVRARRLAADPHPDELMTYWSGAGVRGPDLLGPRATALLAALVVDDLLRFLRRELPFAALRRLRVLDLSELTWSDHPILPVPPAPWRERVSA